MKKLNLQNEKLEQIGRSVFKATRPSVEEIEKVVSAPQLLDLIKQRIKVDEQAFEQENLSFIKRSNLHLWSWQTATAGLSILILCSALIVFLTQNSKKELSAQILPSETPNSSIRADELPDIKDEITKNQVVKNRENSRQTAFKAKTSKKAKNVQKSNNIKPSKITPKPAPEIFYSLVTGGNLENSGEDLRRVRAELSKSDLFALGINLPLENETIKIKTDLLIGEDGVARAIRFVGKF